MIEQLARRSRSYRSFDPAHPATREHLLRWLECARVTPSARNLQMLKYRLVTDAEACAGLLPLTRWAGALKQLHLPPVGHEPTAYLVICTDGSVSAPSENTMIDIGIAAQTFLLAAAEDGFGGCMIRSFSPDAVRDLLGIPAQFSPALVIGLGKPDEQVELAEMPASGSVNYYRENGIHYVPKRSLDDLVI